MYYTLRTLSRALSALEGLFIPITAYLTAVFTLNWEVKSPTRIKLSPFFRKASTITYFVHFIALYILRDVIGVHWHFVVRSIVILAICWLVTAVITILENKLHWKFLKYLY